MNIACKMTRRKEGMSHIIKAAAFAIFIILISASFSPVRADRNDLYCYLQAINTPTKVEVWEEDRGGNKGQLIWRGIVKPGARQIINTRTGNIRYASTVYIDTNDPLSGDVSRSCEEGGTIGVP